MINYVIIGGGWRAEFYLRIARAIPDVFNVVGICVRNPQRVEYIENKYKIETVKTVEEILAMQFDFIVNCINKDDIADMAVSLADKGHYVLCETPIITPPSEQHHSYDKIQVAEQFHLKGTYQVIKKIIDMGIIGEISSIEISVAHDYHAMSLVRFFLDNYDEPEKICQYIINDRNLKTNWRTGELSDKKIEENVQTIKMFRFDDVSVVYNYTAEQYFSPIRRDRLLIRGTLGEIENNKVRYFNANNEFIESEIKQIQSGKLDGFFKDKIIFENKVLYDYPYKCARLSEEEIAIADCLVAMSEYVKSGNSLYSYEKAYQDYKYFSF